MTAKPAHDLQWIFDFGKYKGYTLEDVLRMDATYVVWAVESEVIAVDDDLSWHLLGGGDIDAYLNDVDEDSYSFDEYIKAWMQKVIVDLYKVRKKSHENIETMQGVFICDIKQFKDMTGECWSDFEYGLRLLLRARIIDYKVLKNGKVWISLHGKRG